MRSLLIVPLCLAAAACSGGDGDESNNAAAEAPASLPAGTWHATFEVTKFASTDNSTPALKAKKGDKEDTSNCVGEAQRLKPPPELFAGSGYSCTYQNSYFAEGTINATMTCTRPELKGEIGMGVQGSYTADGFEATVDSTSYLPGNGDFTMVRKVKAKLTPGACQPAAANAADGNTAAPAKGKKGG